MCIRDRVVSSSISFQVMGNVERVLVGEGQKVREGQLLAVLDLSLIHISRFDQENYGKYPIPILRALNFLEICKRKTIYIGEDELIVGERGPRPKAVPTFPELTLSLIHICLSDTE